MSCICQYIINSQSEENTDQIVSFALPNENDNEVSSADYNGSPSNSLQAAVSDDSKITSCVSELASCRAENWLLKKQLDACQITIESLEQLMTTIVKKQQKILTDMFEVRKRNLRLETECNLQREYHSIERDALIKELHNAKTLVKDALSGEEDNLEEDNQSTDSQEFESSSKSDSDEAAADDIDDDFDDNSDNQSDKESDNETDNESDNEPEPSGNSSCSSSETESTSLESDIDEIYSDYEGQAAKQHEAKNTGSGNESD